MAKVGKPARVQCHGHGWMPGYIVCVHVVNKTRQATLHHAPDLTKPGTKALGDLLCEQCDPATVSVDDLVLVCQRCVEREHLIPVALA